MFYSFFAQNISPVLFKALHFTYVLTPLWLPMIMAYIFWILWMDYIRTHYKLSAKKVLLEIKLPKEITKSPAAMEVVLTSLYQAGNPKNFFETYWMGKVPDWFSLELVSIGGEVKFYIWSFAKYKRLIEHQIYAQYPNVEVHEVAPDDDYTKKVNHDPVNTIMWGTYFKLSKADPYPIKTYVDYGLGDDPKEEFKVDPMVSVLEYLGSLRKGEQVWIQLVIRAHRKEGIKEGRLYKKETWTKDIDKVINELRENIGPRFPSKVENETMAAIERGKSKFPFEVTLRGIYYAKKDSFDAINIGGLIGSVRQYSTNDLNGFRLAWFTDFDLPWQDFRRVRRNRLEKKMLEHFKSREFYSISTIEKAHLNHFILTTEEIATLFHFPGQTAATPTFPRIPSKKEEAPPDLPV